MEFRLWTGLWTGLFLLLLVMFNLSFLVKFITRFTEDAFATLVAIIFIIDAIKSTMKLSASDYKVTPSLANNSFEEIDFNFLNDTLISQEQKASDQQAVFFFSIILFIITFITCMGLKSFRNEPYLPSKIRSILSDFAVMIAILIASGIDASLGMNTKKLTIPTEFRPTSSSRGWFIGLYSGRNPWYSILIAALPALIATILVFMDQQITAVIVNRKEMKLNKSHGYHLDLFIVAISIVVCSFLGLPWFVAATVLALTHINSLKVMSENTAPGEIPTFVGIREQRVTTLIMSILIGLSVFLAKVLALIPMAVLFGVFMFMGVSALKGMQFVERILILFMPRKYQPDRPYLRHVNTRRVHLFTIIQFFSIAMLYVIKYIQVVAITFPILVLATCGIRKLLDFVFTQHELFWLDDLLPGSSSKNKSRESFYGNKKASASANNFLKKILTDKDEVRLKF
jgi:anion exchange protein